MAGIVDDVLTQASRATGVPIASIGLYFPGARCLLVFMPDETFDDVVMAAEIDRRCDVPHGTVQISRSFSIRLRDGQRRPLCHIPADELDALFVQLEGEADESWMGAMTSGLWAKRVLAEIERRQRDGEPAVLV